MFWRYLLRPFFFLFDAERAHRLAMTLFSLALAVPGVRWLLARLHAPTDPILRVKFLGTELASPVGLAAGFDKDAEWADGLGALGFGFVEVGTLTAQAQPGNPKPRLFRLPRDRGLVNRFGFNNGGARAAADRLARNPPRIPIVANIGRTKVVPNEEAVQDYVTSFEALAPHARWIVVNVSSPNTPGLRALQDRDALGALLSTLQRRNEALSRPVPLLVKIAPDLTDEQIDDVVDLSLELKLAGIVATNTTVSRAGLATPAPEVEALGAGGLSGAPLTGRARDVVRRIRQRAGEQLVVVGVGGVMDDGDAWELLRAGADLVQAYTGFIYGGPAFARSLNDGLARRARAAGLPSLDRVWRAVERTKN